MTPGKTWLTASALSVVLILGGCSTNQDGAASAGGGGGGGETTTISGKVTLSGVVAGKPAQRLQKMSAVPKGKPGSARYKASAQKAQVVRYDFLPSRAPTQSLANAIVYLYDAGHPEWLYPVAQTTTDSDGNYTLNSLANAAQNGNAYQDGDPIPAGQYTLLAIGVDPVTLKPSIALESVVQEFSGDVAGEELQAQDSTAAPQVVTMMGVRKNTDGTQTWGSDALELASNVAIQVTFSMAMNRQSVQDGISIQPPVEGSWAVSADWLSATFYPADGVSLTPGQTYTVTINGADTSDTPVRNVYGNALEKTATGTFTISNAGEDTQPPTVVMASPATTADVDITTPIRVKADELLDINSLLLQAQPSLGARPGVIYIGEDNGEFIYEFILGEPLKLGQSYDLQITGGTDLAGNPMAPINFSFTTAATSEGIDADSASASDQADVKDVFGRWVRALNDRNLAQVTSLMAGDFFMEYDIAAQGGFDPFDINRDGVRDLGEFSDMLSQVFPMWDYCGTTVTGEIIGSINVVAGESADFEFRLNGDSTNTSQNCKQVTPQDSLFVTLQKFNESWVIVRASEGIDTRGQTVQSAAYLTLIAPEDGYVMPEPTDPTVEPTFNFQWQAVDGASAYVMIFFDARYPDAGMAFALPPSYTDLDIPPAPELFQGNNPIAVEVSADFGFKRDFLPLPGAEINWQVAALGSNTVADINAGRNTELVRDVIAISELRSLKLAGEYLEMTVEVSADVDGDGITDPLVFDEMMGGYDAGAADSATLTITIPTDSTQGMVRISGATLQEIPLDFIPSMDADGRPVGTVEISVPLNQGWNWVEVLDRFAPGDSEVERQALRRSFIIQTTGGTPPVLAITAVADQAGNVLSDDGWGYYQAPGATGVTIQGAIDPAEIGGTFYFNLWNDRLGAGVSQPITINADGTFTVTVDIYQGDNWIDISGPGVVDSSGFQPWHVASFGVYTDTGAAYTPPIDITLVEGNDANDGLVVKNETWPNGANYDASAVASNLLVIEGVFNNLASEATPRYDVGSDGGWEGGDLYVAVDGTFRLVVELYNGWNYINLSDGQNAWYSLNVYTKAGKAVVRPQILSVGGQSYAGGDVTTDQCSVEITGTAEEGAVYVYWNGNDGQGNFYWEDLSTTATDSDGDGLGEFTVTVPLVSGGDNFVDINDAQYRWTGLRITTTGSCGYTPPTLTFGGVKDTSGNALTEDPNFPGQYDAGSANQVVVHGTHSDPGRTVRARQWVCGGEEVVETSVAADGSWSLTVELYDQYSNIEITDGVNFQSFSVTTTSPSPVTPVMAVTGITTDSGAVVGAPDNQGCDYADYWSDANLANASSVTIEGTSANGAGTGTFQGNGANGTFTIDSTGAFTLTVNLYDGPNFISLCDAAWSCYHLTLQTSNGISPPAYVSVTSPAPGASVSGDVVVSGTIDLAPSNGVAWSPDVVFANVDWCDATGVCQWLAFSTDPNAPGDVLPLSYDATTGEFSFTIPNVPAGDPVNVNVVADDTSDPNNFVSHGVFLTLNDANATEAWYFKPKAAGQSLKGRVEALQRLQALRAKTR